MRPFVRLVGVAAVACLAALHTQAARATPPVTEAGSAALATLVESLLPSVVNITILKQEPGANGSMAEGASEMTPPHRLVGSGFIIDPDGYIMTNHHVVEGAYAVTVVLSDERAYAAQVVSTNDRPDLALLKIDAGRKLPAVKMGDSDALRIGETVIAIGNPLGLSSTVTVGVVSALNRDINDTMIDDYIQTDAAINRGNSGGPLFNVRGEVVGVNSANISREATAGSIGLGLAIPSNDARFVAGEMREFGHLKAGYLGVRLQQLTPEIAASVGLDDFSGGIISDLRAVGPGAQAGLRKGDIILQFGDRRTHDIRALLRVIGAHLPGTTVPVTIWRNRAEQTIAVTLGAWPPGEQDPAGVQGMPPRGARMTSASLGMRVAALTPDIRTQFQLDPKLDGVIVLGVAANSVGADVGFARGDVVTQVEDTPVHSLEAIHDLLAAARQQGRATLLMLVVTDGRPHWLPVATAEQ
jgi:serine protease Do